MAFSVTSGADPVIDEWIHRFTDFPELVPGSKDASQDGDVMLLTGSTGVVGCHILHALVQRPHVAKVYCLVRQTKKGTSHTVHQRLEAVLTENHISDDLTQEQRQKINPISYDVFNPVRLGLTPSDYDTLRNSITVIIHNAWPVNFNMAFSGFEAHCRGTFDLLSLAMQSALKTKPSFVFISTMGAIVRARPFPLREQLYSYVATVNGTNYGTSKWVTEQICAAAAASHRLKSVSIIRLSQICGDTKHGMWNPKEALPRILATAYTIGSIPITRSRDETYRWLPSDVTGAAIADIALLDQIDAAAAASIPPVAVYHMENNWACKWQGMVLPALRRHGMTDFEPLPWVQWAERLAQSDSNVLRNPPYKLARFFTAIAPSRENAAAEGADATMGLVLDTTRACRVSPRLAQGIVLDEAMLGKFLRYWKTRPEWAGQDYSARLKVWKNWRRYIYI